MQPRRKPWVGRAGADSAPKERKKVAKPSRPETPRTGREFSGRARDSVAAPLSFLRGFPTYRAFTLGYILAPLRG